MADVVRLAEPVAFFTGAGISVSAGLPTYRGPGGMYSDSGIEPPDARDVEPGRLPALWQRFRGRLDAARELHPTPAHRHIAGLDADADVSVVTQNVDGLHRAAGSRDVIELHGTLRLVRCPACGLESSIDDADWVEVIYPHCPACASLCRPGVVLFGESLPAAAWSRARSAMARAATVVAVGTSAEVWPAAGLLRPDACPAPLRLWVNPSTPPPDSSWTWLEGAADPEVLRLAL